MRSFGWSVIQCDLCSYERILGRQHMGGISCADWRWPFSKAKRVLQKKPVRLLPWTFSLQECEESNLFKLLSLQYFVMESLITHFSQTHCLFKSVLFSFHMSFFWVIQFSFSYCLSSMWLSEEILCINSIFFFFAVDYIFLIF